MKHTAGSVKLLLPPRQSRGISPRMSELRDLLQNVTASSDTLRHQQQVLAEKCR